jgi:hypothetical protein
MTSPKPTKRPLAGSRTDRSGSIKVEVNTEDRIRQRAWDLYEARGREDGHDLEDWLQAEEEIAGIRGRAAAA